MIQTNPPTSISDLMLRVDELAGISIEQLAHSLNISVPHNLLKNKGWIGQLIEIALGAEAGSKAQPDFIHLGVELKTIPINKQGKPLETTYVTVAPLLNTLGLSWHQSVVYQKLQKVLWLPIEGEKNIPLAKRKIGTGFIWQPSHKEETLLRNDWEEIMELISLGKVTQISAHHGEVLQLRPKAANSHCATKSINIDGKIHLTNPRGFYLKTNFTHQILLNAFK